MLLGLRDKWDSFSPRAKIVLSTLVLIAVFVVPVSLLFYHQTVYSAKITLTFAPKSATAKIGDMGAKFGDNDVKPGTYKVEISKKGFATYTQNVSVEAGKTVLVEAALESNDPSTTNWYQDHVEDYSIAQGIGDRRADREYAYMKDIFPIAQVLPIVNVGSTYRVDYGISPTETGKYAIFISYDTEVDKQEAIDAVKAKGYDLSNYEVIYTQNDPTPYGSVNISGVSAFSKRGLSAETVNTIQEALVQSFTSIQGEAVISIAVTSSASHTMSEDRQTDTYSATILINAKYDRKLTVVIRSGSMTVTVSGTDGSGPQTIYNGSIQN